MKNLEKDKIVVRQFKDGSNNFWCDGVHYNLNEDFFEYNSLKDLERIKIKTEINERPNTNINPGA